MAVDPLLGTPEDEARKFLVLLAKAGTQRAAAEELGCSQWVVVDRRKKARALLGDAIVLAILKENSAKPVVKVDKFSAQCGTCGGDKSEGPGGKLICRPCVRVNNKNYKARKDLASGVVRRPWAPVSGIPAGTPKEKYDKLYYQLNADRVKATVRAYASANLEKVRLAARARSKDPGNKKRIRANHSAWKKRNPHKVNADTALRHANMLRATVTWSSPELILECYELARLRTRLTGIQWVVDHIVPLNSDLVCGLHCEANLQVIPAVTNVVKLNLWWPDMPDAAEECLTFSEQPSQYLYPPVAPAPFLNVGELR